MSLLLAFAVMSAQVLTPADAGVAARDLTGLSLTQAVARLGGTDPAPPPALVVRTRDGGVLAVYPLEALSAAPNPAGQVCAVRLTPPDPAATPYRRVHSVHVAVRDGRVVAVINPPIRPSPPRGEHESDARWFRRAWLEDRDPALSVAPGRLPLSDADGFLERRPDLLAPQEAIIRRQCRSTQRPPAQGARRQTFDSAGFFQGLSLLPFAWRLPQINAEREAARGNGPRVLAQLRLGQAAPGGATAFARRNRGVRRHADAADPAYEVLSIDMGAGASRNLAPMHEGALVGVRDGVVVWLADSRAAGLGVMSAMCVDENRRAGAHRRGCSNTGVFNP